MKCVKTNLDNIVLISVSVLKPVCNIPELKRAFSVEQFYGRVCIRPLFPPLFSRLEFNFKCYIYIDVQVDVIHFMVQTHNMSTEICNPGWEVLCGADGQ